MCKKNLGKRRLLSRRRPNNISNSKCYSSAIAPAQIGERPIPVLTGKSAVCFFMKASEVEKEMGNSGVFTRPAELSALKKYAESVAAMEAESQKFRYK